jgi:hypothetical protein
MIFNIIEMNPINPKKKVEDSCVAISQLKLVKDVHEHIKGYLFYDAEQVFLRNEKKKYIDELKNAEYWELSNHWTFMTQRHQFQILFCSCGDYLVSQSENECVKCSRAN